MKELFVPYNISKTLRDKGYDEELRLAYYKSNGEFYVNSGAPFELGGRIEATLYQQVIDWLREKHRIDIGIGWTGDLDNSPEISWWILVSIIGISNNMYPETELRFDTYGEARLGAITHALTLIP